MRRSVLRALLAPLAAGVVMLVPAAGGAQAVGEVGNAPNAKACQHGGWQQLIRGEDGSSFANEGECVAHAARGGELRARPDHDGVPDEYRDACTSGGWQQLIRGEDGSSFANEGECVAHVARGGELTPRLVLGGVHDEYHDACTSDGGIFYDEVSGAPVLGCAFVLVEVGWDHPDATATMEELCTAAGGSFVVRHETHVLHVVCSPPV